jgi:hypothetical protein
MIPIEILITSICLNVIYIIIKLLENNKKYHNLHTKLYKSKSNLEKSIRDYKSISETEINDDILNNVDNFIDIMDDLNKTINFKNI